MDHGLRVRIDDSDERPGAKYYRWELQGVPVRVELGPRDLAQNSCMLVRRDTAEKRAVPIDRIPGKVQDCMDAVVTDMYHAARDALDSRIFDCETLEDVSKRTANGIARICWCLDDDCGREILGIPVEPHGKTGPCPICGRDGTPVLMARTY
jgi:prolyl-tRNA synthetase